MRDYRALLNQRIGAKELCKKQIKESTYLIKEKKLHLRFCEKTLIVLQQVSEITQQEFSSEISKLITAAMTSIFENPYSLEIEFVQSRGTTAANIYFIRDGEKINPLDSSGGGAVDVACFALRISFLKLHQRYVNPNIQNILILDEPLRFLSHSYLPFASSLIRELSDILGIQIIMITHLNELAECSHKQIKIKQTNGVSFLLGEEKDEQNSRSPKKVSSRTRYS